MKYLLLLLVTLLAQPCLADSKADKVATLVRIKHQREYFQDWLQHGRLEYEARARTYMAAEQAAFSAHPEYEQQYQALYTRFIKTTESALTTDAYIMVVSQYYSGHYSEAELDGLIHFYSSALGQKERAVQHDADQLMEQQFTGQSRAINEAAMNDFLADYNKLSVKCGCLKKNHP